MATTLTDVDKIRRLPWLVAGDVLNISFVLLTFSGPVFVLFLDELGLGNAQIGLMLNTSPATSQGNRRIFSTSVKVVVIVGKPLFKFG